MSNIDLSVKSQGEPTPPSLEPWLLVCLLALIPGVLIVILPRARLVPLLAPIIGGMVVLLAIGFVMLWRTDREHRRKQDAQLRPDVVHGLLTRRACDF
jgi:hypothetical protein